MKTGRVPAPPGTRRRRRRNDRSRKVRTGSKTACGAVAQAAFPTLFGEFTLIGFEDREAGSELTAVVRGDVRGAADCPVRVHSECHTGDIFGSLRCDCREQLEESLRYIAARDRGAVIYLRQEGRGIGLLNKIRAYHLQDQGLDTVAANEQLGFPADARDYRWRRGSSSCSASPRYAWLTNNPAKIAGLQREGIAVTGRIPVVVPANRVNGRYLATQAHPPGHLP